MTNLGVSRKALISPHLLSGFAGKSQEKNTRKIILGVPPICQWVSLPIRRKALPWTVVPCLAPKSACCVLLLQDLHRKPRFGYYQWRFAKLQRQYRQDLFRNRRSAPAFRRRCRSRFLRRFRLLSGFFLSCRRFLCCCRQTPQ